LLLNFGHLNFSRSTLHVSCVRVSHKCVCMLYTMHAPATGMLYNVQCMVASVKL
jgi:hypothetical protein